ncbi:hypothetical protein HK100_008273 [Physocladia obscura]|uniref:Alternative oxidase n=1 Tax=Physocladia obscura TaxID=109957 RepID=A0AAD5TAW1_9FUNG|nr:hypothetical protein HK100_008273 [Physocladia obscura]
MPPLQRSALFANIASLFVRRRIVSAPPLYFLRSFASTSMDFNSSKTNASELMNLHPKTVLDLEFKNHEHLLYHPVYTKEELDATRFTHRNVQGFRDIIAFSAIKAMRFGMVAGMARHMRSLRSLHRDNGWINTLLQEAENERMHLLTFMKLKNPGIFFRTLVLITQGIFFNAYFIAYLLSPKTCHRFVGYLEESAVHTYTLCLKDIEGNGKIAHWGVQVAPEIAKFYWRLGENATIKDLIAAVRADEADHRDTNHVLANLNSDDVNPLA